MTRPHLTVIPGGRNRHAVVTIRLADLEELHVDHITSRAERVAYTGRLREQLRKVMDRARHYEDAFLGHLLDELTRINEQESQRAMAMDAAPCPCGREGPGHGEAKADALAVPEVIAA